MSALTKSERVFVDTHRKWLATNPGLDHGTYTAIIDRLQGVIQQETARADEATKDRDHWKANHDYIKLHCAVLRDRFDLPAERLKAYQELCRHLEDARSALSTANNRIKHLEEELRRRQDPNYSPGVY